MSQIWNTKQKEVAVYSKLSMTECSLLRSLWLLKYYDHFIKEQELEGGACDNHNYWLVTHIMNSQHTLHCIFWESEKSKCEKTNDDVELAAAKQSIAKLLK